MSTAGSNTHNTQTPRSALRASVDTVEYREMLAKLRDAVKRNASEDEINAIESVLVRHVDAHLHDQIVGTPVGTVDFMPGTNGFTMAVFKADDVPVGTQVYTGSSTVSELTETHRILSELCYNHDPKVKIDELARMVQDKVSRITGFEADASPDSTAAGNGAGKQGLNAIAEDLFGVILWLYRRLPQPYGRQGFVDAAIEQLATIQHIDATPYLAERDAGATPWNRGALPKQINDLLLHIQNVLDNDNWRKIEPQWMDAANKYVYLAEITGADGGDQAADAK